MRRNLLTLWAFVLLAVGGMSAAEVTFDFKTNDYGLERQSNGYVTTATLTEGIVNLELSKTAGNGFRLWSDGLRVYKTGTGDASIGVKITNQSVQSISMTVANKFTSVKIGDKDFDYDSTSKTYTWTGNEENPTIVMTQTGGNYDIASLTISYESSSDTRKPADIAFAESKYLVDEGATFTAPVPTKATTAALTYVSSDPAVATVDANTGDITILGLGTTEITASAEANAEYKGGKASYTLDVLKVVNSIAETKAITDKTLKLRINYALTVAYKKYNNNFVTDGKEFIQIYGPGQPDYKSGDVIPAGWEACYDLYNDAIPELINPYAMQPATENKGFTPALVEAVTVDDVNKVVNLASVTFAEATPATKSSFTGKVGETEYAFRNNYEIASKEAGTYNVTCVVNIYNNALQLYPISINHIPEIKPITLNAEAGDLTAQLSAQISAIVDAEDLVGDITINLAKDATYTLSASIEAPAGIVINGNGATIDASALSAAFIKMSTTPSVEKINDYYRVNAVKIADVTVKGLKNSIFYDNNTKYCVVDFTIDNSEIQLATEAVENEALVSFKNGGAKDLTIKNSTIYGTAAPVAKYFVRYNNSARLDRYGYDKNTEYQVMTYISNTFYNVIKADGQWGNYNGIAGQAYSKFDVQKNIWVDCSKDIIRRMIGGRFHNNAPRTFAYNTYILNGEDLSTSEASYDKSETILVTNPDFADAATGNFTIGAGTQQAKYQTGAPKWLVPYVAEDITEAKAALLAEIQAATALLGDADITTNAAAKTLKDAIDAAQNVYDTAEFNVILKEALETLKAAEEAYKTTGIADVTVDENAPVEYFNLQGVRVENPSNGLYIKRQGSKITKVIVK